MRIITDVKNIRLKKNTVVSVGVFDGVHIGHQRIIGYQVRCARALGLPSVVITFDPHPMKILEPQNAPPILISLAHRLRLLEERGIDIVLALKFTRAFSKLSPEAFVKKYLVGAFHAKIVLAGPGFFFGRYRDGDTSLLKSLGEKYRFAVKDIKPILFKGIPVSSTRIRRLIRTGMLEEASEILGRPVSVLGTVTRGCALGRTLGYPTANVNPHHEIIPPAGVYAVKVKYKGKRYGGVLNIGVRPTFLAGKDNDQAVEVHIFDFKGKIYGEDLEIDFVQKLREERRFSSREALVRQIKKDEAAARAICA